MTDLCFNFTTDHHFSHRTPGRRQGDYFLDLGTKMSQVIQHCVSTGSIPLFGGDLFHLKDPDKIATYHLMKFMGDMANLLRGFPRPPLCAIGNHDIRFDRFSTLPEQPLGLMAASGLVKLLTQYNLDNLQNWIAPSGRSYLVHKILPGEMIPTGAGSFVFVYSTPYIDDPQDLLAYLGSEAFHSALGSFVGQELAPIEGNKSVSGILLLHTLSGSTGGEFYGLFRAPYSDIHKALAYSTLGRATSAVLFGHEHPEMGDYVIGLDQSPILVNNLPPNCYLATNGTIYINPSSFARSVLDYDDGVADPVRPVYMVELTYTPSGLSLGLATSKIPLLTRPLEQLFGHVSKDPLNQEGDKETPEVVELPPPVTYTWASFSDALAQIDQVGSDPQEFMVKRLKTETPEVASTVNSLLIL